ncbi:large conductance mechanosensitive channel protein MscL [Cellulomonas sp. PhB143]|uniref:large conductance mechanosensitive channel protein MscL n=1 Tax=Cellulomonas sp. PhB143 TaxID=2485186 RepID=UPI000F4991A6|nr:large conductance mechanosensitive channel protein MscL [Cellulomonas sp. PhB143]ROS78726.1 large conductance mechanosensitive channel [Cellulomonas sp. PhB143]
MASSVVTGFKEFVLRGNAVDLAVGVVIGAAFTAIVNAIVDGLISPLIAAIFGKPDLTGLWNITLRRFDDGSVAQVSVGLILNAILQFLLVAAAVYFVIIVPMNSLAARRKKSTVVEEEPKSFSDEVLALHEIRDLIAAGAVAADGPAGGAGPGSGSGSGEGGGVGRHAENG